MDISWSRAIRSKRLRLVAPLVAAAFVFGGITPTSAQVEGGNAGSAVTPTPLTNIDFYGSNTNPFGDNVQLNVPCIQSGCSGFISGQINGAHFYATRPLSGFLDWDGDTCTDYICEEGGIGGFTGNGTYAGFPVSYEAFAVDDDYGYFNNYNDYVQVCIYAPVFGYGPDSCDNPYVFNTLQPHHNVRPQTLKTVTTRIGTRLVSTSYDSDCLTSYCEEYFFCPGYSSYYSTNQTSECVEVTPRSYFSRP